MQNNIDFLRTLQGQGQTKKINENILVYGYSPTKNTNVENFVLYM